MVFDAIEPHELLKPENKLYLMLFLIFVFGLIGIGVIIGYFLPR